MSAQWPALTAELEASVASLRERLGEGARPDPRAAERHAIERALDRYQRATAAVNEYVDAFLLSTAPRPRH